MPGRRGADPELRLSYEVAGIGGSEAFFDATNAVLGSVFGSDGVAWNYLDVGRRTAALRGTPAELEQGPLAGLLAYHARDHPIIRSYLTGTSTAPRRLSDVVSRADLLRTGTYVDVLRPLGINFQLSMITSRLGATTGEGWAISRGSRDFTDDDLVMATRLQSMLSLLSFRRTRPRAISTREAQAASGLTNRELEVLQIIADGHTAHAASRILRIAPATVRKHLERVYTKLGTHDRLMAVRRAQALGLVAADDGP